VTRILKSTGKKSCSYEEVFKVFLTENGWMTHLKKVEGWWPMKKFWSCF